MQNILIVEDDIIQADKLLSSIHTRYPSWTIATAATYAEASTLITDSIEQNQPFTLFLLDVQLSNNKSDCSGFILAENIRSMHPYFQVPILFLTSITDNTHYLTTIAITI